jgi:hypothetical protein
VKNSRPLQTRLRPVLIGASTVLLLACASPVKTAYEAAPDTDFSKYQTYAWLTDALMTTEDPIAAAYISPQDDARVRTAVAAVLDERGAQKAPAQSADVIVAFSVTREAKTKQRVDPGRSTVYYPGYSGQMGYHTNAVTEVHFVEGTLTIQFFDRESRQHIWSGWGSKHLSKQHESPEHLKQAVEQILRNYPPPQ